MNYLIINLTRFGDLLQSQVLVRNIKHNEHKVAFLCLENFYAACDLILNLDDRFALNSANLLENIHKDDWLNALSTLHKNIQIITRQFKPDVIINLTPSIAARTLTLAFKNYLPNIEVQGFGLDELGYSYNSNIWASYLLAASKNRSSSSINLVDIFCKASNLFSSDNVYALNKNPKKYFAEDKNYIALQLGASTKNRVYSTKNFAELSKMLVENGFTPVLLGVKAEETFAKEFYAHGGQALNLIAQTDMLSLAQVLQECKMLITNDTGTMHLAAGLNVPIIAIFVATAQVFDTAPYTENCILLEANLPCHPCQFNTECPNNYECQSYIAPEYIFNLVREKLNNKTPSLNTKARTYLAYKDEFGFLRQGLVNNTMSTRQAWAEFQYQSYRQFLDLIASKCGFDKANFLKIEQNIIKNIAPEVKETMLDSLRQVLPALELLVVQGELINTKPNFANAFLENNTRISLILAGNKNLEILADLYTITGQDLATNLPDFINFTKQFKAFIEYLLENIG